MIAIEKTQPSHLIELSRTMRLADVAELHKMGDLSALEVLVDSIAVSTKGYTVLNASGAVVAVYGVSPHPADNTVGIVWLLGSDLLDKLWIKFGKLTEETLRHLSEGFEVITNITDEENTLIIRWLEWCGFGFSDTRMLVGPGKHRFVQFYRRVTDV